jgi:hypothetical protein
MSFASVRVSRDVFDSSPVAANRQPAFALYLSGREGPWFEAHAIELLTLQEDAIAALTIFREPHRSRRLAYLSSSLPNLPHRRRNSGES